MNDTAVTFRDVEKRYRTVTAVRGMSLQLNEGEIFGLVGPDGSGKTTLLEMLCGLREPTRGEICGASCSASLEEASRSW